MKIHISYKTYIETLKKEIVNARIRANLAVNRELILLYWKIGSIFWICKKKKGGAQRLLSKCHRT